MKWQDLIQSDRSDDIIALFIYSMILIYVLMFRVIMRIVGPGESEFFPIEILTTACIIAAIYIILTLYKGDKLHIGRKNILYPCLLFSFFAYYLAENNWLSGRDNLSGVAIFGTITGLIFMITFFKIFKTNLKAGIIFAMGIFFLVLSTLIDSVVDGYIPMGTEISYLGLIEEVLELYASMFFLHSIILVYMNSNSSADPKAKNWQPLTRILMCGLVLSYINSILLFDHSDPVPVQRILLGVLMIVVVLSIISYSFVIKRSGQHSEHTFGTDLVIPR